MNDLEMEILQGAIAAVVYHNYDNGYAVLRLRCGDGQTVTVVGTIPMPAVGERLMVTGRWSTHQSYGKQFEAEFLERLMPESATEILAYLSSRVIKGIGPRMAARIVDHFGANTLLVMEREPDRLAEVPGISLSKARTIGEEFRTLFGMRQLMEFFAMHQLPAELAVRTYKLYGDLLLAYGYMAKPKAESVTCLNYYADPAAEITIPLDPSLSASANAQEYYKQFRKAKRKMEMSEEYIKEDRLAIDYLRSLKTAIMAASTDEDIKALEEEIREEITSQSQIRKKPVANSGDPNKTVGRAKSGKASSRALRNAARIAAAKKNGTNRSKEKHRSEETLSYRKFTTSDGYEIMCGRNNIQNDQLTFGIAEKTDWWFHIKDLPGTHVILKAHPGEEFPSDTAVIEAAQIAAFFSKSDIIESHSGSQGTNKVEIDYCLVANVKKIAHAKPGMVIYGQHYSILVDAKKPE